MESPLWHTVGIVAVVAFAGIIALSILARRWFSSDNVEDVKRGAKVLSSLGGARTSSSVEGELRRRNVK